MPPRSHLNAALLRCTRACRVRRKRRCPFAQIICVRAPSVSSGFAGQTHLVMGFGNLTPRNGVVTEPHKSLLTPACWLRL